MAELRVEQIQGAQQGSEIQAPDNKKRRLSLNTVSHFESAGPRTFAGIGRPDLSALRSDDQSSEQTSVSPAPAEKPMRIFALLDGDTPRNSIAYER